MSRQVWKFLLPAPGALPWVEMPKGSTLLHVAVQDGVPYVWALVQPEAPLCRRHIVVYPTGVPINGWPTYLATFHIDWTVWHVFYGSAEHALIDAEASELAGGGPR